MGCGCGGCGVGGEEVEKGVLGVGVGVAARTTVLVMGGEAGDGAVAERFREAEVVVPACIA